ncbi:MAG: hypothetical protein RL757_2901 [Bacteroidota bacterium]|jgi:inorganic pyrophosphatase
MTQHPWHEVSAGRDTPLYVTAVIEIPRGSREKYEIDKASGLIRLDRYLAGSMVYPTHYGIIPKTVWDDGDPLDILVITSAQVVPLTLIAVRVIGVMRMTDQQQSDDKIIAVAERDPTVAHIESINDLPRHLLVEIENFFENYTKLEGKTVAVHQFLPKREAEKSIERALRMYEEM